MDIRSVLCKILLMVISTSFSTTWCINSRTQLEERLTAYVKDTLKYIETAKDFCDQNQKWTSERKAELDKMRDINENQQEGNLDAVLKDTLKGLEKLEPFLDAVEKLTVTSQHVFSGQIFLLQGKNPVIVQLVISNASTDAPVLILLKRNAKAFFQPLLDNINVLIFELDNYVVKTNQLCERMRTSLDSFGEFYRMRQLLSYLEKTAVHLDSMKKGASISTVVGSSVGIVGGVLSFLGIFLVPVTAGTSLGLTVAGATLGGISGLNAIVTDSTEMAVNRQNEQKAQSYIKSFKDDMRKIEEFLNKVGNSERPLVQPRAADAKEIVRLTGEALRVTVDGVGIAETIALHKSTQALRPAQIELNMARNVPQVATYLSRTEQVAKLKMMTTLRVTGRVTGFINFLFIGLDVYSIYDAGHNLAHGSETEVSKLIRSRAVLWKSELEAWEKMYDSLCIGRETISKREDTVKKPFLP